MKEIKWHTHNFLSGTKEAYKVNELQKLSKKLNKAIAENMDLWAIHMFITTGKFGATNAKEEFIEQKFCRYCQSASKRWNKKIYCKYHQKFIAERHINLHKQVLKNGKE